MSYTRVLESGHYIYPDGEGIHFDDVYVPDETVNVFLAKIYNNRREEFNERVDLGTKAIEENKLEE